MPPPSSDQSCPQDDSAAVPWFTLAIEGSADPEAAVAHGLPHRAVSQVLRPTVAGFLPPCAVKVRTVHDARCCVTQIFLDDVITPEAVAHAARMPRLTTVMGRTVSDGLSRIPMIKQLQHINLRLCPGVDSAFFTRLRKLLSLRSLTLWLCPDIASEDLKLLGTLRPLEKLTVSNCPALDKTIIPCLAQLPKLRVLDLYKCQGIDADALARMSELPQLLELKLTRCAGVDEAGIAHLTRLRRLRLLSISQHDDVELSAAAFAGVSNMRALEEFELRYFSRIDVRGILRHLRTRHQGVDLAQPPGDALNVAAIPSSARACASLTRLDLSGCDGVLNDECFAALSQLSSLRRVELHACEPSDFDGRARLGQLFKLSALEVLGLGACPVVDAESLSGISMLAQLRELQLWDCGGVDDTALLHISKHPALRVLDLSDCGNVTAAGLEHLSRMPRLRRLDLSDCSSLTAADIGSLPTWVRVGRL